MIPIQNQSVIRIVAALIQGNVGHVLLVRKRGALKFMQRGCKVHDGESPLAALERELREELMFAVPGSAPVFLGTFTAPAANEEPHWWRRRCTAWNSLAP
jgi:hypothetical protein